MLFSGCFDVVGDFVLVLGVFPGDFLFAVAVCPGFGAISGMFCCCGGFCPGFGRVSGTFSFCGDGLSWFWCYFRDVLLLWGILSLICGCSRDILRQE